MKRSLLFEDVFGETYDEFVREQHQNSNSILDISDGTDGTDGTCESPTPFEASDDLCFPYILDTVDESEEMLEACNFMDELFNKLNKKSKERVLEAIKQRLSSLLCLSNDDLNTLWIKANTCPKCQAVFSCKCST